MTKLRVAAILQVKEHQPSLITKYLKVKMMAKGQLTKAYNPKP